jgi:hypothetical protein
MTMEKEPSSVREAVAGGKRQANVDDRDKLSQGSTPLLEILKFTATDSFDSGYTQSCAT